jgi:response regulator RpfG family c-di-GMP phosphodiesterase
MSIILENINLFHFPLNIMIVDDNMDYLNIIQQQIKNRTFSSYNSPIEVIKNIDPIEVNTKYFLENNFSGIQDLSYENIKNFVINNKNKHGILISDYEMPNINGIELFSKLNNNFELIKILLTNVYTTQEGLDAVNKKLIHYYLPKDRINILLDVIKELQSIFFNNITRNIMGFLDSNSLKFLSDENYIYIFNHICQQYNITKYYIINSYGSYYLESETDKFIFSIYNISDLIEIANEVPEHVKHRVEQGDLIPSYFSSEYELVEAKKYGNYSYCVEKIF